MPKKHKMLRFDLQDPSVYHFHYIGKVSSKLTQYYFTYFLEVLAKVGLRLVDLNAAKKSSQTTESYA